MSGAFISPSCIGVLEGLVVKNAHDTPARFDPVLKFSSEHTGVGFEISHVMRTMSCVISGLVVICIFLCLTSYGGRRTF